jgi:hypothetical protein
MVETILDVLELCFYAGPTGDDLGGLLVLAAGVASCGLAPCALQLATIWGW